MRLANVNNMNAKNQIKLRGELRKYLEDSSLLLVILLLVMWCSVVSYSCLPPEISPLA